MPTASIHLYRRTIRFADTDAAGVAHFTRLLAIAEEAVHDFFECRRVPLFDKSNSWPVVSLQVDYSAPCLFRDDITIALMLDHIGTSSLSFSFDAKKQNGSVCFTGKATLCHIDPARHAPAPIPDESRTSLTSSSV